MNEIGKILNKAKVSNGTVHFSLAFMLCDDTIHNAESADQALAALASVNNFMYMIISSMAQKKFAGRKH